MKIRNGFVSNSSSSSFLVAFETRPTTLEEMRRALFAEGQTAYVGPNFLDSRLDWDVACVAQIVLEDLENQVPLTPAAAVDAVWRGHFEGIPTCPHVKGDVPDAERGKVYDAYDRQVRLAAQQLVDRFLEANVGTEVYLFEYADDTRLGSAMEHGDLFQRLPHIRVSNH